MKRKRHPLSEAWGDLPATDREALRKSIERMGVVTPIITLDGMVLDGWHRLTISEELGIDCPEVTYDGGEDPVGYVIALNNDRGHRPPAQRARAVLLCNEWLEQGQSPGQERNTPRGHFPQVVTGEGEAVPKNEEPPFPPTMPTLGYTVDHGGKDVGDTHAHVPKPPPPPAPPPAPPKTNQEMAEQAQVSPRTIVRERQKIKQERSGDPKPKKPEPAKRKPTQRERNDDLSNMLVSTRREVTELKRQLEDTQRQVKLLKDDARPDAAAKLQELANVQQENTTLVTQLQHWQQRFGEEQRRAQFFQRLLKKHGIDIGAEAQQ